MVVHKRRKITRQRGSRTHGWGLVHRGSGNRGGVGNAGTGKKAHGKKPSVWKEAHLGKHGFVRHGQRAKVCIISIKQIEQSIEKWSNAQLAVKQQDVYTLDLAKLGYSKLLSTGKATKKINVTVASAAHEAVEKIKAAGGSVTIAQ
ncbi:MAG: uL15 family ribosomal protein [Candidatus Aenigmarchaeota archaeon]|nr:uL15 family ribosomal protein [Candidatus Aenigmarchaeota archaeon]